MKEVIKSLWRDYGLQAIIFALLIVALIASNDKGVSKSAVEDLIEHKVEMERIHSMITHGEIYRESLRDSIESLMNEIAKRDSSIKAIEARMQKRKKDYENEKKSIPTWSDARRDSFWRVESSR